MLVERRAPPASAAAVRDASLANIRRTIVGTPRSQAAPPRPARPSAARRGRQHLADDAEHVPPPFPGGT